MTKRYMVIIPVHKPPYAIGFGNFEKAAETVNLRIGMCVKTDDAYFDGEKAIMFSAGAIKRSSLPVNERATYFANLPSAEDDIFGTAIVAAGGEPNRLFGFTVAAAEKVIDEINEI